MPIFATNTGTFSPLSVKGIRFDAGSAASAYVLDQSLEFWSNNDNLTYSPSLEGNRKKFTVSCWVRRGQDNTEENILVAGVGSPNCIRFDANGQITVKACGGQGTTKNMFLDGTGWYHICVNVDTTIQVNDLNDDRLIVWVNGIRQPLSGTLPTYDAQADFMSTTTHYIGKQQHNTSNYFQGALSDFRIYDGYAYPASTFGSFDIKGTWSPKAPALPTPNDGTTWSSTGSDPNSKINSGALTALFDGSPGSGDINISQGNGDSAYVIALNNVAIECKQSFAFFGNPGLSTPAMKITEDNGVVHTIDSRESAYDWVEVPFRGTITKVEIAYRGGSGSSSGFGGFKADGILLVDGQTDTSTVYNGTPATNMGTHLKFASGSIGTNEFGSNWTVNSITNSHVTKDAPVIDDSRTDTGQGGELIGGFPSLNGRNGSGSSLSRAGTRLTSGSAWASFLGDIGFSSGKWYYEVTADTAAQYVYAGIAPHNHNHRDYPSKNNSWAMVNDGTCYYDQIGSNAITVTTGTALPNSGTVGIAVDADEGKIWWSVNGTWIGDTGTSPNPATGTDPVFDNLPTKGDNPETLYPCMDAYDTSINVNFGAKPFVNAAPSGFKCLNYKNISKPSYVDPRDHFDVLKWKGDGAGTNGGSPNIGRTIGGLKFDPDFVWSKCIVGNGYHNNLWDTLRGYGKNNALITDYTVGGEGAATGGRIMSVSNGSLNWADGPQWYNESNYEYVALCFNAGDWYDDSAYTNRTQKWSDMVTANTGNWGRTANPRESAFDGDVTSSGYGDTSSANLTFAPTTDLTFTDRIEIMNNQGQGTVTWNGNTVSATSIGIWRTVYRGSGTINATYPITITGATGFPTIAAIRVDGKILCNPIRLPSTGKWSDMMSTNTGPGDVYYNSIHGPGGVENSAFDGRMSGLPNAVHPSSGYFEFAPTGGISFTTSVRAYWNAGQTATYSYNGGSNVNLTTTTQWITIASGSGTLNSLRVDRGGDASFFTAIEVDGEILRDPGIVMPGMINNQLYDQRYNWSSSLTSSTGGNFPVNYEAASAFDGTYNAGGGAATDGAGTMTYTHPIAETVTSLEVRTWGQVDVTLPGGSVINSGGPVGGSYKKYWRKIDVGSGFSFTGSNSITIAAAPSGYTYFDGIRINGKELVDTESPQQVPTRPQLLKANNKLGFSVTTYQGTSTAESSIEGLNHTKIWSGFTNTDDGPEVWFIRNRKESPNDFIVNTILDSEAYIHNQRVAADSPVKWFQLPPDNGINAQGSPWIECPNDGYIHLGYNDQNTNMNGHGYVIYSFKSVPGISKFGVYRAFNGSNDTDGPYVQLGFKPKMVWIKCITHGGNWLIALPEKGSRKTGYPWGGNTIDQCWSMDLSNLDTNTGDVITFHSNGFYINNNTGNMNYSDTNVGRRYLYFAFAEIPDYYANNV